MLRHPLLLRAEERLDVGRVAAVLIGRREQVFDPGDAVGLSEFVVEARVAGVHAGLLQALRHAPPGDLRVSLGRLVLLPDLLLLVERGRSDGAELAFIGHIALRHLIQHRRQDIGEQTQLADLANRQSQGDRDRFLSPAKRNQTLDCPPLVDGIELLMRKRFGERAHRAAVLGPLYHQHRDLLKPGRDGLLDAAMTGIDDEAVATIDVRGDDGRLHDADGTDGREQQGVCLRVGL